MERERWEQVEQIFHDALRVEESSRGDLVRRSCAGDDDLRREVESLLAHHNEAGSFIETPAFAGRGASQMTLAAGTKLDGYEVLGPLGAGGMGEVYRARDTVLKREVAIKVLPLFVSQDPDRLRRFEQEAQATAALNHPNILAVYRCGTYQGAPYLVSELLDGGTLGQQLGRGPLPIRKAIDYGIQIARGLAAAQGKGIVHRDLKPENIFITRDGQAKILDFGLAKLTQDKSRGADGAAVTLQEHTDPGRVLGTVGYMSPEQVRGEAADHRADIFAFGAILYEMLTGKRAFRKPTAAETMTAILNEEPPGISQIVPSAPPALLRIVNRCLEKDPEQRFHSASDLAFALEALSASSSSSIAAIDQGSGSRWERIVVTGAVVGLAAALVTWWRVPPAVPVVESIVQLTDDGEPKDGRLVSDGPRVYFNEGATRSWKIAEVSAAGGRTALLDTGLVDPLIAGMAPDGSALLAEVGTRRAAALWMTPLPAGEPRRVGIAKSQDADFLPDGRILFAFANDLYVCDRDGSNSRKLVSAAGAVWWPSVSPDGKRIVFTLHVGGRRSLVEVGADGTGLRSILNAAQGAGICCSAWSPDQKYVVYVSSPNAASDLWALPMGTGLFHRSREPIRLTTGALSFRSPVLSRDGKQIFAIGAKQRGELVRYDVSSRQFLPFLPGVSALGPTFSKDGKWVAYTSYPDHTLWRSRSDGSERVQLTYPPMEVGWPFISPDGTRVAFTTSLDEIYVISMDGGPAQKIVEKGSCAANWSPDGNLLVMTSWVDAPVGEKTRWYSQIFDFRTGKASVVPSSQGTLGVAWVTQDTLVAAMETFKEFRIFDFHTQKWTDLATGDFVNWAVTRDGKYFVYATGGAEPKVERLRFADRQTETIASLKDLRRVVDSVEGGTEVSVAPDGSPIFTRDIGSQEIYALNVRWP
jgi:eukaryotic-like serine/threonine-protein kinase